MTEKIRQQIADMHPRIFKFGCRLTGTTLGGDELAQETCRRAIDKIDTWKPGTSLHSWMYMIARRLHWNNVRDRRDMVEYVDYRHTVDGERAMELRLLLRSVLGFISRMPKHQRDTMLLVVFKGMPSTEAAKVMGVKTGTIASRLCRARASINEFVEGYSF